MIGNVFLKGGEDAGTATQKQRAAAVKALCDYGERDPMIIAQLTLQDCRDRLEGVLYSLTCPRIRARILSSYP